MRPLQGLDRRFFIDTDNNRLGRRINIETHNIGSFRRELRVVTLAPGLAGGQIDVVLAQETPNILNVNIPQRLCQQRTRPSGIARRRRLIQERQNAPVRRRTVDRLLVRARAVLKSGNAVIGKTPPPFADDARLNTHFLSDRARAAAFSRQQYYPRTLHVALSVLSFRQKSIFSKKRLVKKPCSTTDTTMTALITLRIAKLQQNRRVTRL